VREKFHPLGVNLVILSDSTPCSTAQTGETLVRDDEDRDPHPPTNGEVQFRCCKCYTELTFETKSVGKNNRVKLPACVVDNIRNVFPNSL
jgi:hypothetical protein